MKKQVTRKARLAKIIESDILEVLKSSSQPVSTREIAVRIKRSWHSVQNHCLRLQLAGKINGFTISNLNVWVIKR